MADHTALTSGILALLPPESEYEPPIRSLKEPREYSFFGTISKLMSQGIDATANFMLSNTNDTNPSRDKVVQALSGFLVKAEDDCQLPKAACWFTIRMTTGDPDTKTPRWHQDGKFFDLNDYNDILTTSVPHDTFPAPKQHPSKYATTFLGPSTPFLDLQVSSSPLSTQPIFNLPGQYTDYLMGGEDQPTRAAIASFFESHQVPVVTGQTGQIARFAYTQEHGVVHSEPDMSACDRVFASVLFGSEEQVRGLCQRWKAEWQG